MARRLLIAFALLALVALPACGGSSEPAPAPAPAPAPKAATQPVANESPVEVARDQQAEERQQLRAFGRAASRACVKAERRFRGWEARVDRAIADVGPRPARSDVRRLGRLLTEAGEAAEYEYDLLREIELPENEAAQFKVFEFFDAEEEGLLLTQRVGIELQELNDRDGVARVMDRLARWMPHYRRAGEAVYAAKCIDKS